MNEEWKGWGQVAAAPPGREAGGAGRGGKSAGAAAGAPTRPLGMELSWFLAGCWQLPLLPYQLLRPKAGAAWLLAAQPEPLPAWFS